MRFSLIDRITEFQPGVRLTAVKNVSLSEEYLADHFPRFPVLPGVFMLEAMTQAGAWLVRLSNDFAHSIVTLKEVRNVKYADFVQPGSTLHVAVEIQKEDGDLVQIRGQGTVGNTLAVSGRIVLQRSNMADFDPAKAFVDRVIVRQLRTIQEILTQNVQAPESTEPAGVSRFP